MISGYKAVGFDMDGTLLNTKVDMKKMADLVFDEMVRSGVPEDEIDRDGGFKFNLDSGMDYLVRTGRADEIYEINRRISKAARDVEMENVRMARPFPGSVRLLNVLRKKGYKVGVLTRGCREYAETALTVTGVIGLLDGLVCRDDFPESEAKPSPRSVFNLAAALGTGVRDILYLGDHKFDYLCARDSGAGFIGVLSGGYRRSDWASVSADIELINTVADLLPAIDE
jgi:phosphoglycolate phosphatase